MNGWVVLLITILTVIIVFVAARKCSTEMKLLMLALTMGIYVYSGVGIAQPNVSDDYIIHYAVFLTVLLFTIRIFCNSKVVVRLHATNQRRNREALYSRFDRNIDSMRKTIRFMTVLFFLSLLINMVYPTNRLSSLFNLANFTSQGIHARRIERDGYLILSLADTINVAMRPFFFVYLFECASTKRKRFFGFVLILSWIVLEFGKYNYLSRYELVIYLGYIFMYFIVCRYKRITIDCKTIVALIAIAIALIPFLVSFTDWRLGVESQSKDFRESLDYLIRTECYYPEYYDICVKNAGTVSPLQFILWVIFLPIPSAIWSGKPVVQIAYQFTGLFTSNAVTAANYSNLLPSILGESFLIFGPYFFWIEAIILGTVIGIYFKYFLKSQKLSMLTAYMLLMLVTIGRGGSQSYIGVIINGSIVLIIWTYLSEKLTLRKK